MTESDPWLILLIAIIATFGWRLLGCLLAGQLNTDSPLFAWITCVSYALVTGLMLRSVLMPVGLLTETSLVARFSCLVVAILVWFLLRRQALLSVLIGVAIFSLLLSLD